MVKLKAAELEELPSEIQDDAEALREAVRLACDVVRQLTEQRKRAVDAFYDLLLDVEAEHQKRAKKALAAAGAALARNGHLPPHKLQPILDTERKVVSELHLRNVICFGDLRLCLSLDADRDCVHFKESVERARLLLRERRVRAALSSLQEAVNNSIDEHMGSTLVGREYLAEYERRLKELKNGLRWTKPYPYSIEEVVSWERKVLSSLQQIDVAAENISKCLFDSLNHLKLSGVNQIEDLKRFLLSSQLGQVEDFQPVYLNVCQPLLAIIDKKIAHEPANLMVEWQKIYGKLSSKLKVFTSLLVNASELWNLHCKRKEKSRTLTLEDLSSKGQDTRKCTEARERRIESIIEKCRQEVDQKCVVDHVARIFKVLDDIKCSYESWHTAEKELLDKHPSKITPELDSLLSSLTVLLEDHERQSIKDDKRESSTYSTRILDVTEEIERMIEQCEESSYEDLKIFLNDKCRFIVQQEEQDWVLAQVNILQWEHDSVIESLSIRYDQIRSTVELARLNEINEHVKLFDGQKKVAMDVNSSMEKILEETYLQAFKIFKNFDECLKGLKDKGLQDVSVEAVEDAINQIEITSGQCKQSVKNLNDQFHRKTEEQLQTMKKYNMEFLKSLRCFSDGGSFAESEVSNLKSDLAILELDAEVFRRKCILSLKRKSKECCFEAMQQVTINLKILQLHMEDITFIKVVSASVQSLQETLKELVANLKYKRKLSANQAAELGSYMECTSDVSNKWRYMLEVLEESREWLLGKDSSLDETEQILKSKYADLLMHGGENSFLSAIARALDTSLQNIECTVIRFYEKKSHDTSKNEEDIQRFMSEIIQKYRLYQGQCILSWITEINAFLQMILKVRCNYGLFCDKIIHSTYQQFSVVINDKKLKLNDELITLRSSYQHYQIETMAKFNPTHGAVECYRFTNLCAEFEKMSELMNLNIKKSIDSFMEKAKECLHNYDHDIQGKKVVITATLRKMFGNMLEDDLVQRIDKNLRKILLHFSFQDLKYPIKNHYFVDVDKMQTGDTVETFCPEILQAIASLLVTIDKFRASQKQDAAMGQAAILSAKVENSLQEARKLVHIKTCEVKNLYEQYNKMAQELRVKWKNTLTKLRHHDPILLL